MSRYILSELPQSQTFPLEFQIITPSKAIAFKLKVPHYSLESLAQTTIRQQGLKIASALFSCRVLQDVVREIVKTKDIEGTVRSLLPTIAELLRSGVDLIALKKSSSFRIRQLADITIAYQQQLHAKKYFDSAELFWQAKKVLKNSTIKAKAYLFYGYFISRPDEIAFLDEVAGNDSIFVCGNADFLAPKITQDIFSDHQNVITSLQEKGWSLNLRKTKDHNFTLARQLQECFFTTAVFTSRGSFTYLSQFRSRS